MRIEPCEHCHRHVTVDAEACPFCGMQLAVRAPRVFIAGRLSRAAVIAGAAVAGCYTSTPAQQNPTQLHPADERVPDPPPPPPDDGAFAKPPVGTGSVRGVVVDGATKSPIQGVVVYAIAQGTGRTREARTDQDGRYEILDLPAGTYSITFSPPGRANAARYESPIAPGRAVTITDGSVAIADSQVTYTVHAPPPPYGAPPPRRRVV